MSLFVLCPFSIELSILFLSVMMNFIYRTSLNNAVFFQSQWNAIGALLVYNYRPMVELVSLYIASLKVAEPTNEVEAEGLLY